jgi:molybdenum cofactor guanylyltransferase
VDTGLILAGGRAERFGRPKSLEEIGGKTMVERVVDAVAPLAAEILVSVSNSETADRVRRRLPNVRFVVDVRRSAGPIEGIVRGAEQARGERILLAPCDAPFLRTELYRLLLECLGRHDAAVPMPSVFDPVRAVYRTRAVVRVLGAAKPPESPSELVDRLDTVFVEAEQLRSIDPLLDSFVDVNTRSDLDETVRRLGAPGG